MLIKVNCPKLDYNDPYSSVKYRFNNLPNDFIYPGEKITSRKGRAKQGKNDNNKT